jgi:hypothetical protein
MITCHLIPETPFPQISTFVEIQDLTYMEEVTDSGLVVLTGFSF